MKAWSEDDEYCPDWSDVSNVSYVCDITGKPYILITFTSKSRDGDVDNFNDNMPMNTVFCFNEVRL